MLCTHLASTPVPGVMLPLPLLICVLALVVSFWCCCYRESSASGVLQQEECEVDGDGFFFLTLESSGGQFYDC